MTTSRRSECGEKWSDCGRNMKCELAELLVQCMWNVKKKEWSRMTPCFWSKMGRLSHPSIGIGQNVEGEDFCE